MGLFHHAVKVQFAGSAEPSGHSLLEVPTQVRAVNEELRRGIWDLLTLAFMPKVVNERR